MITVKNFVFNPFYENTAVLYENESLDAMIIDPGCNTDEERAELDEYIDEKKLNVVYLINSHAHIDHILGNRFVYDTYLPGFYMPENDLPLYQSAEEQASAFGITLDPLPEPVHFLSENLTLLLGETELQLLFTPGHTPGEFCIYVPSDNVCITGDVLFKEGIGRTDLWGGNMEQLLSSIQQKLLTLPEDTRIYPGHGPSSTIGHEKKFNPFLA